MPDARSILNMGPFRRRPADGPGDASRSMVSTIEVTDLLVGLLEYRDPYFRGGSSLTGIVAVALGGRMGLDANDLQELALAALLRDLGRLVLGGQLIQRPTFQPHPDERKLIERHVELGMDLLESVNLPPRVRTAVRHHHENWDGSGYPAGLKGEAIPIAARIISVADSFAAMIRPRPYRTPLRVSAAAEELERQAGTRYDARVVTALKALLDSPDRPIFSISPGHHVLVVHADEVRGTVVSAWLCQHGFLADVTAPDVVRDRLERVPVAALLVEGDTAEWDPTAFIQEMRTRSPDLPIIAIDIRDDEAWRRSMAAGADGCLMRDGGLTDLRARLALLIKRADPGWSEALIQGEAPAPATWHALNGSIADFPLHWLLQVMKYDNRTAAVVLETLDDKGTVYLASGDPVHATTRVNRGEAALREMLVWREGSFLVRLDAVADEHTITSGLMHFLLDEAVAMDHQQRFGTVAG